MIINKKNIEDGNGVIKKAEFYVRDFSAFALHGNALDLAVGVIVGGAFNNIIQSLTHDIILPLFGKLLGNTDFSNLTLVLSDGANPPILRYGVFINNVINFLIIALSLFIILKILLRKKYAIDEVEVVKAV